VARPPACPFSWEEGGGRRRSEAKLRQLTIFDDSAWISTARFRERRDACPHPPRCRGALSHLPATFYERSPSHGPCLGGGGGSCIPPLLLPFFPLRVCMRVGRLTCICRVSLNPESPCLATRGVPNSFLPPLVKLRAIDVFSVVGIRVSFYFLF